MVVSETYKKNVEVLKNKIDFYHFDEESKKKVIARAENPMDFLNKEAKALLTKYSDSVVDYRIEVPYDRIVGKKLINELYLASDIGLSILMGMSADINELLKLNASITAKSISSNSFSLNGAKRKFWKYIASKAEMCAKIIVNNHLEDKVIDLKECDEFELSSITRAFNIFLEDNAEKNTSVLRDRMINLLSDSCSKFYIDDENIVEKMTKSIKDYFRMLSELIAAKTLSAKKIFQTYLSFNIFDYILASTGEDWESCLSFDSSMLFGFGCAGMSTCPDLGMFLLTKKNNDGSFVYKGACGFEAPKMITRSWLLMNNAKEYQVIKWYPVGTDETFDLSNVLGGDVKFRTGRDFSGDYSKSYSSWAPATYYNGLIAWNYTDCYSVVPSNIEKEVEICFDGNASMVDIGRNSTGRFIEPENYVKKPYEEIRDKGYGDTMREYFDNGIVAENLLGEATSLDDEVENENYSECEICGGHFPDDEMNWVEAEEIYVCDECLAENYFYCSSCGDHYSNSEANEVYDDIGSLSSEYYCDSCLEEMMSSGDVIEFEDLVGYYNINSITKEYYCVDDVYYAFIDSIDLDKLVLESSQSNSLCKVYVEKEDN